MNRLSQQHAITIHEDRYGGVIIDSSTIPNEPKTLNEDLVNLISGQTGKKLIWVTLPIERSGAIPVFIAHGFIFYDCSEKSLTLLKRLVTDPITPTATNHTIGVGAFVRDGNKILVIKDRIYRKYKLPGGYVDNSESISQAVEREVLEETGVKVRLESVSSLGHFWPGQFNESNLYIVCSARPLTREINITDSEEIIDAKWIDIDEYLNSEDIHPYNRKIVKSAIDNQGLKFELHDFFSEGERQREFFF